MLGTATPDLLVLVDDILSSGVCIHTISTAHYIPAHVIGTTCRDVYAGGTTSMHAEVY